MARNIVLLSDGTGNSAANLTKSNVWRLYQTLDLTDPEVQIAFYDDGVGTSSFKPLALVGGAFGYGVKRNVLDLYTYLCRNYREGDRIFLFGFSRGAFTARVVAGLIAYEGLVSAPSEDKLQREARRAYRAYRAERYKAGLPLDRVFRLLRDGVLFFADLFAGETEYGERRQRNRKPDIAFLGVWDTVAAYGLPVDEMTRALNKVWRLYPKDRDAPPAFRKVCHALALDDERYTFHPMLFNEEHEPEQNTQTREIGAERITQVWFAGMHSNVGGGYPDDGLAHHTWKWMAEQAAAHGLELNREGWRALASAADPFGKMYDSRRGLGGLYRYMPRRISLLANEVSGEGTCVRVPRPKIHESVFRRLEKGTDGYSPIGLPAAYAMVNEQGGIVDGGGTYESAGDAMSRANDQERVWNTVWWKRVVYFATVLTGTALALFPLYLPATATCETPDCFASPWIGWVGKLAPGFLDTWVEAYKSHPGWFVLIAGAFVALLKAGSMLQVKISSAMRAHWLDSLGKRRERESPAPGDALYRLRTHPAYLAFFALLKKHIMPALFGLAMLAVIAGTASRLGFRALTSVGAVCDGGGTAGYTPFRTDSPCWNTGVTAVKGRSYDITLTVVNADEYRDDTIRAGLGGFSWGEAPWTFRAFHPLGVLFRRNIGDAWFKPAARIGDRGTDEYALDPADGTVATSATGTMTARITARRSGTIYLFVNDAVLPLPPSRQCFYSNNHGQLTVAIQEVTR